MSNLFEIFHSGGMTMYPLLLCSLIVWGVIFERFWIYRKLGESIHAFHLEAMNGLLRNDVSALKTLCARHANLPNAQILQTALEKLESKDVRVKTHWVEAVQRRRQFVNLDLRRYFWILGTIASSAPFIGLGGTVVGILRSFHEMAKTGSGGFAVVAAGISESLVATAAGIIVAVIAVIAFNAFQTRWSTLVLIIRTQTEELIEIFSKTEGV